MKKLLALVMCAAVMLIGGSAWAHSYQQGDIRIGHIWTRATPLGATTAAIYVPFLNTGKERDRLISASTSLADKVEIHEEVKDGGMMKMQKLDAITLEPNVPVSLRPGGIHLMVFGLKQPLKEGEMLPLTLQFEKAGIAKVDVMIESVGAMSGAH
ncbi:MAG: copper chaperone PCu(A)C [Alphaproteobacteria bacterium]